jgi:ribosome-binding protein aMBF1 (putative translation factor)
MEFKKIDDAEVSDRNQTMDGQDWTTVTLRKRLSTKDAQAKGQTTTQTRDPDRGEKMRLAKLDNCDDIAPPKKRVHPESIQTLIRKRLELGLTQDKADQKCSFSKHTFKDIESHKSLPTPSQHSTIQRVFGVQLTVAKDTV